MFDFFKSFAISLLSLGIIVSFLELIMPSGNMKKFVKIFVSIFVVLNIIVPFTKVDFNKKISSGINDTLDNFVVSAGNFNYNDKDNLVKEEFLKRLKNDIYNKLKNKNVDVESVFVILDNDFNVSKLNIKLKKENDAFRITDILRYIEDNYGISISNIEVIKEG